MNVRKLLRGLAVLLIILVVPVVALLGWLWVDAEQSNIGRVSFVRPLAIPPLAESTVDPAGTRQFDLRVQPGRTELRPGMLTETWGVNGTYLGPTLRVARGERVAVNVHNGLDEATSLHWHGMELPAVAEGGPHTPIRPGATWSPSWTVDQPAATLWYHPHLHGNTADHIYRGVAGMFIVDDQQAGAQALPGEYGVDDVPLIVQDKKISSDGALDTPDDGGIGRLGDEILVNGTWGPYLNVTTERVRLRVLNASVSRVFNLGFTDDRPFALVGTDTGLLSTPAAMNRLQLSPGERVEIVVTFAPEETATLRSYPPGLGSGYEGRFDGGDDTFDLLQLRAAAALAPSPEVPQRLSTTAPIQVDQDATVRTFEMQGSNRINNQTMSMDRVDAAVLVGETEIWQAIGDRPHSFHVHNAAFRVLDVDGQDPPAHLSGRKDTVYLPPGKLVRLAVEFGPHPDPNVPFMFHCHLLTHEDKGMMGQFVVVRADQIDDIRVHPTPAIAHAHH